MLTRRRIVAVGLATAVLVGCGDAPPRSGGAEQPAGRSPELVDFSKRPPYVNGLEIDPADGAFLLTTNRGFFRVSPDGGSVVRQRAEVLDPMGSSPVGTFLEISAAEPGVLLGSGHPDDPQELPPYLGLMRSTDGGRRWSVVSRLGEADLHQIRLAHGRMYAYDAVLGALLLSEDGGREWVDRPTPRGLVLDFVVDPDDEDYVLTTTEDQLFRTEDRGRRFRPVSAVDAARLDWPEADALMRADADGTFRVSADRGQTWETRGNVGGEAYRVKAVDGERAFVALADGTITATEDGGRSWQVRFRP